MKKEMNKNECCINASLNTYEHGEEGTVKRANVENKGTPEDLFDLYAFGILSLGKQFQMSPYQILSTIMATVCYLEESTDIEEMKFETKVENDDGDDNNGDDNDGDDSSSFVIS